MTAGHGSRRRARASGEPATERGYTLVEMLITVWILGAVVVTMCGALFTATSSSDFSRRQALAEVELRHFADLVRATPYEDCDLGTVSTYTAALAYTPADPQEVIDSITKVQYWDGSVDATTKFPNFVADSSAVHAADSTKCDSSNPPPTDFKIQDISIQVTVSGAFPVTQKMDVIKRANQDDCGGSC